ncbi:MAG: ABC transporter ATP-binding protein [Bacteroidales bacterium]|jgi:ABC-type multidrug transport system ATPase subunit|nr:ABC transporter ATP-binding protein [Bacteroidales bacterium]NPV36062.1 ABC transporter ATP-binding protein [Bacteroidales bacterium]
MQIILDGIGKKFGRQWVFRRLDLKISAGGRLAILGANGSGKSTLLKIISGWLNPSEGSITYSLENQILSEPSQLYSYISIASPYLELIEEFTLAELVHFHFQFKKPFHNMTENEIIGVSGLEDAKNKLIRHFSSGMKQRARLTLALLSDTPLVLLDEPCSNLDASATEWFHKLISTCCHQRTLVVCSNHQPSEYDFCTEILQL